MLIVSKFWTSFFSFGKANAVTVYPFIFFRNKQLRADPSLVNHEKIHLHQALECGILIFYLWYVLDFMVKYIRYRDFDKAYRNIIFEREAYTNEEDLSYLSNRKFWSFLFYIKK